MAVNQGDGDHFLWGMTQPRQSQRQPPAHRPQRIQQKFAVALTGRQPHFVQRPVQELPHFVEAAGGGDELQGTCLHMHEVYASICK